MPSIAFYHIEAPHEGKVAVVKDGQMIDFTHEGRLGAWINSEKESSFAEFTLKTAKRFLKHKFVVIAVDKGKLYFNRFLAYIILVSYLLKPENWRNVLDNK